MKPCISIVMSAYNAEKNIAESINSVLCQSFRDFELIVVNDGSSDDTQSVVDSFDDRRLVKIVRSRHDFIKSLNTGMAAAKGKYVARMDADDIMHVDRLRIQHALMEENPEITVCTSWLIPFGEGIANGYADGAGAGIVDRPLLRLLERNIFFNPTSIMRRDFIRHIGLKYKYYDYAEDYKWWVDMAEAGAVFHIEPQPLLYYRISDRQVSTKYRKEQHDSAMRIRGEILDTLIVRNAERCPELKSLRDSLNEMKKRNLFTDERILGLFSHIFETNKNNLFTEIG